MRASGEPGAKRPCSPCSSSGTRNYLTYLYMRLFALTLKGTQYQGDIMKHTQIYTQSYYDMCCNRLMNSNPHIVIDPSYRSFELDSKNRLHLHALMSVTNNRNPRLNRLLPGESLHIDVREIPDISGIFIWLRYIFKENKSKFKQITQFIKSFSL